VDTLTTAEMLAATRTAEDAAAVWLSAALRDMREDLPRAWYGDTVVLMDTVRQTVSEFLAGRQDRDGRQRFWGWSSNMRRPLPDGILSLLPDFVHPHARQQFVALACLSVAFVTSRTVGLALELFELNALHLQD